MQVPRGNGKVEINGWSGFLIESQSPCMGLSAGFVTRIRVVLRPVPNIIGNVAHRIKLTALIVPCIHACRQNGLALPYRVECAVDLRWEPVAAAWQVARPLTAPRLCQRSPALNGLFNIDARKKQ